jgi:hypothetical protein
LQWEAEDAMDEAAPFHQFVVKNTHFQHEIFRVEPNGWR